MRVLARRTQHNRAQSGFTLLEIMVAFTVLATAVVALLGLRSQTIYLFTTVQERLVAISLAEDRLERILMQTDGIQLLDETSPEMWERYGDTFIVEHEISQPAEEFIPPGMIFPVRWSLCQVDVTVSWQNDRGTDKNYTLSRIARVRDDHAATMGCGS